MRYSAIKTVTFSIFLSLFCLQASPAKAMDAHAFGGLTWGSDVNEIKTAMSAQRYVFARKTEYGDLCFSGNLLGWPVEITQDLDHTNHKLVKSFVVFFLPENDSKQALSAYRDFETGLIQTYGPPSSLYHHWDPPYSQESSIEDKTTALLSGNGEIGASWDLSGTYISMRLNRERFIQLSYESPAWGIESDFRRNTKSL